MSFNDRQFSYTCSFSYSIFVFIHYVFVSCDMISCFIDSLLVSDVICTFDKDCMKTSYDMVYFPAIEIDMIVTFRGTKKSECFPRGISQVFPPKPLSPME